ncbi:hypothetical protein ACFPTO_06005 [Paraburkholderia denitrificans]|uniref:Curli production assembly/transport component CsgG n=1 Tax=Paraburkholderia denitrificans TaxID=694025 RepID=A0ABW0J5V1_9BURK
MSMKPWIVGAFSAGLCAIAISAHAETISEKGMASVAYAGWSVSATDRQEAVHKAELNALERYIADADAAKSRIFSSKKETIVSHIDDYILGATTLNEQLDKDAKTYSVVIRADINGNKLMNDLGTGSASAGDIAQHGHGSMTFLFLARNQSSVQSFDDRVTKRADADSSFAQKTNEGESIHSGNIGTSGSKSVHASTSITTGGSTLRQADRVNWSVSDAGDVDTAMTGVFSDAGYDVVEADQVEGASGGLVDISKIRAAYGHGNDLPSKVMYDTTQGVQRAGVNYLALGTLDVGMPDRDPVSGNMRVFVVVTGKVFDVQGRFARTLTSIGPIQYAGLGPDASVAQANALKEAANQAAHQMVDQLSSKGIH